MRLKIRESSRATWTTDDIVSALREMYFLERASAHIQAGWTAKVPEFFVKTSLAEHFQDDLEHAYDLRGRLLALGKIKGDPVTIPNHWQEFVREIDGSQDTTELLAGLYVIKSRLLSLYKKLLLRADRISESPSIRLVRRIAPDTTRQIGWAKATAARLGRPLAIRRMGQRIDNVLRDQGNGNVLPMEDSLWAPLDRVADPVRPNGILRGKPGALRLIPVDPLRNRRDIGMFLHGFLNEEFTTMELVCRNSYEHPEMPWSFHLDMAHHAADEARHARMIERAATDYGVKYGQYPIYTASYVAQYQFQPCETGSKKELLWRILLRQTFYEGLALDSLAFEVQKRTRLGQADLANVFRRLLADEVFHAQSGLKWSRYLCGGDEIETMRERERAHEYFVDRVKDSRARFIANNMEAAAAEVEHLEEVKKHLDLPIRRTANIRDRREAGFTDQEIQQIIEWGYVQRE